MLSRHTRLLFSRTFAFGLRRGKKNESVCDIVLLFVAIEVMIIFIVDESNTSNTDELSESKEKIVDFFAINSKE